LKGEIEKTKPIKILKDEIRKKNKKIKEK